MSIENLDQNTEEPVFPTLEKLVEKEESLKRALDKAIADYEKGEATEPVVEDLRDRYIIAKQAREDFEEKA